MVTRPVHRRERQQVGHRPAGGATAEGGGARLLGDLRPLGRTAASFAATAWWLSDHRLLMRGYPGDGPPDSKRAPSAVSWDDPSVTRTPDSLRSLPSVDRLLRAEAAQSLIARHGRTVVTDAIRETLAEMRKSTPADSGSAPDAALLEEVHLRIEKAPRPSLRPVYNLTGTVLHTNLGRATLPREAIDAVARAAQQPSNLEFDIDRGVRGDRDSHLETLLCRLTGAEAATVVNNNAAAVLLVLNALALRKEVPVSRGELIEIGGSFRLPDIMARAGCRLREVGTTNRVHLHDYADAIGPRTGAVMKVHTSNYEVVGFTSGVLEVEIGSLCHERGVPFVVDLGSGTLVDLRRFGLPHEPTPAESFASGADVVTFSGDKLLGGPQAGVIVGRADVIARIRRNPLKRALRVDKLTIAALTAVLDLYRDPDRLAERLPVLRILTRPISEIRAAAHRLEPLLSDAVGEAAEVRVVDCHSQVGSGALPTQHLASSGLAIAPRTGRRGGGAAVERIAARFRALPMPIIGRIQKGALVLDLRCLEDEANFVNQLGALKNGG
jgi:L-seryl-tRNA(Ser) seleniumtransferase